MKNINDFKKHILVDNPNSNPVIVFENGCIYLKNAYSKEIYYSCEVSHIDIKFEYPKNTPGIIHLFSSIVYCSDDSIYNDQERVFKYDFHEKEEILEWIANEYDVPQNIIKITI